MADFRQIIWRESLRSLCKHSTRVHTVLPHNVAWPFLPFLPSCRCHLSAAMICGRKAQMAPALASMLRQKLLPDNVASTPPHLCFHSLDDIGKAVRKHATHLSGQPRAPGFDIVGFPRLGEN